MFETLIFLNDNSIISSILVNTTFFNKSIEIFNQIIERGFFTEELYLNLGNSYFINEDYGNARWSYEMGLKLSPFNNDLIYNNKVNKSFIENYNEN